MEDALAAFRAALDARIAEREKREDLPAISDDGCQACLQIKPRITLDMAASCRRMVQVGGCEGYPEEVDTAIDVASRAFFCRANIEATMSENAHLRDSIMTRHK